MRPTTETSDFSTFKNRPSLVTFLARALFLSFVVIFIGLSFVYGFYERDSLRSMTNERLNYILSTQADNSAQLLWDLDMDKIATTIKNMADDRNIRAVRIIEIVGDHKDVVAQQNWDGTFDPTSIFSQTIIYKYQDGTTRELGAMEIAVDYTNIEQKVRRYIIIAGILLGGVFLLLIIMVYAILRHGIDPITKLSASLNEADYFTHKIEKTKNATREINDLFDALITMQQIMQNQTNEIEKQKIMLDTIIDEMPLGVYVENITKGSRLIIINNMFKELFASESAPDQADSIEDLLPEDSYKFMTTLNQKIFAHKQVIQDTHSTYRRGEKLIADIVKAPILDEHGHVSIIVTMVRDVTEQIDAHEKLFAAKEAAEIASQTKTDFLANMSHELRTPLNSIMGMTRILMDDPNINMDHYDMADIVLKSASNLLDIVNDILDISKIESGTLILEEIPLDFKELLKNTLSAMMPLASKKGISLNHEYKNDFIPFIIGDPLRISRILTNLISNSLKYTNEGHVEVIVRTTPLKGKKVEIYCQVKDTGIGIPKNKLTDIFDKFMQADVSDTRRFGGTGLGLAITKELVELMNGEIGVESFVGKGSNFWFKIPFDITEEKVETPKQQKRITRKKRKVETLIPVQNANILVAEDHMLNQTFIKKVLKRMGLKNYTVVENGILAIDEFKNNEFHAILMDCHMPEKNGYEATAEIREMQKGREIPIIALTADAMKGTRERCIASGMNEYISKPIDLDVLKEVLGEWINFEKPINPLTDKIIAPPEEGEEEETEDSAPPPVDMEMINDYADSKEELEQFINIFIDQSDICLSILEKHCIDGECKDWVEAAHKLKGSAAMIGAENLRSLCADAQDMPDVTANERLAILEEIRKHYDLASKYLKTQIS